MAETEEALRECFQCGLFQRVSDWPEGGEVYCVRCGATLRRCRKRTVVLCASCAAAGLSLFWAAVSQPLASVFVEGGRFATSDLLTSAELLGKRGSWGLSVIAVVMLVALPAVEFTAILAMALGLMARRIPAWVRWLFAHVPSLREWATVEVFLLGAMIALFRLKVWMRVEFGPALLALGGIALCLIGVDAGLDRDAFWRRVPCNRRPAPLSPKIRPIACHGCGLVTGSKEGARCPRCGRRIHARKVQSVKRTSALLSAAAFLAVPANILPMVWITKFGHGGSSTILGGTVELVQRGLWPLAMLVFVASVLVPLLKLVVLAVLLLKTWRPSSARLVLKTRIFRFLALIGRWSMLDIYAAMTLVAMARFGWLGSVLPGTGATAFGAVVILTMLAASQFDPRLMWDNAGSNSWKGVGAVATRGAGP